MSVFFTRRGAAATKLADTFSENTWEQIIEACQMNNVPDTWVIGDSKPMVINNKLYQIDIIGKNHDVYSDGTGNAPLTFQMHDCYDTKYAMHSSDTNSGSWPKCKMRTTNIPTVRSLMPIEVQSALRKVSKFTSAGSLSDNIDTSADDLFILSEIEVFGVNSQSKAGEGVQYEYYKNGNSVVKKLLNSTVIYWLRSPKNTNGGLYCCVNTTGDVRNYSPTSSAAISIAFCF